MNARNICIFSVLVLLTACSDKESSVSGEQWSVLGSDGSTTTGTGETSDSGDSPDALPEQDAQAADVAAFCAVGGGGGSPAPAADLNEVEFT